MPTHAERRARAGAREVHVLEPPDVRDVLVTREDYDVRAGVHEHLRMSPASITVLRSRPVPGIDQVVVQHEDLEVRRRANCSGSTCSDRARPCPRSDRARSSRRRRSDPVHLHGPMPRPDQLFEVHPPTLRESWFPIVWSGAWIRSARRQPGLELLSIAVGRDRRCASRHPAAVRSAPRSPDASCSARSEASRRAGRRCGRS